MDNGVKSMLYFSTAVLLSYAQASMSSTTPVSSTACFSAGGDCGFHSLKCSEGLTIYPHKFQFGFKQERVFENDQCDLVTSDCTALSSRSTCCQYDQQADCLRDASDQLTQLRTQCDNRHTCTMQGTRTAGGCERPPLTFLDASSYSVVTYVCQNVTGNVTSSEPHVTSPMTRATMTPCDGSGCVSTMMSGSVSETTREKNSSDKHIYRDEGELQLIVGVSVGVGSGVIALAIIAAVCWLRMRRKPPSPYLPQHQRVSRNGVSGSGGTSSTFGNQTLTSSIGPSSHFSSIYSDTLPSSSHTDSVYSMPLDLSNPSTMRTASFLRHYGYNLNEGFTEDSEDGFDGPPFAGLRPNSHFPDDNVNRLLGGRHDVDLRNGVAGAGGRGGSSGSADDSLFGYLNSHRHLHPPASSIADSFGGYSNQQELLTAARRAEEFRGQGSGNPFRDLPNVPADARTTTTNNFSSGNAAQDNNSSNNSQGSPVPINHSTPQSNADQQNRLEMLSGIFSLVSVQLGGETRRSVQSVADPTALRRHDEAPASRYGEDSTEPMARPRSGTDPSLQAGPAKASGGAASGLAASSDQAISKGFACNISANSQVSQQPTTQPLRAGSVSAFFPTSSPPLSPQLFQGNPQPLLDMLRTHVNDQLENLAQKTQISDLRVDGQRHSANDSAVMGQTQNANTNILGQSFDDLSHLEGRTPSQIYAVPLKSHTNGGMSKNGEDSPGAVNESGQQPPPSQQKQQQQHLQQAHAPTSTKTETLDKGLIQTSPFNVDPRSTLNPLTNEQHLQPENKPQQLNNNSGSQRQQDSVTPSLAAVDTTAATTPGQKAKSPRRPFGDVDVLL